MFNSARDFFFLLCFLSICPSTAQELYVRNRSFQGEIVNSGTSLLVEVQPLAEAFDIDFVIRDNHVFVGEQSVAIAQGPNGATLVVLEEFAGIAGLAVRKNKDFGHFDVYTAPDISDDGSYQKSGGFSIKVPAGYQLVDDPETMKSLTSYAGRDSGGGRRVVFVLAPKPGTPNRALLILFTGPMRTLVPPSQEMEAARAVTEAMGDLANVESGPAPVVLGNQQYYKTVLSAPDPKGMQSVEAYFRPANDKRLLIMLMLVDATATFTESFPPLRQAAKSFR